MQYIVRLGRPREEGGLVVARRVLTLARMGSTRKIQKIIKPGCLLKNAAGCTELRFFERNHETTKGYTHFVKIIEFSTHVIT